MSTEQARPPLPPFTLEAAKEKEDIESTSGDIVAKTKRKET